ncbi:DnaJ domain-containing protein [Parasitella parasitica]|nr:DnaJ domain-containing protein [Parasitella parasitica]
MSSFKRSFHSCIARQRSFYDVLHLNERADKRAIKSNYYKLSKKYHPDLNPNNKEAHKLFLEINEAYAILGNEASKKKYDYDRSTGSGDDAKYTNNMAKYSRAGGGGGNKQAWHFRNRRPRSTGSASAQDQAERMRQSTAGGGGFNHGEHFNKHYAAEEHRRKQRVENAARRRRAGGDDSVPGQRAKEMENVWGRFWRLGALLAGIAYATQHLT